MFSVLGNRLAEDREAELPALAMSQGHLAGVDFLPPQVIARLKSRAVCQATHSITNPCVLQVPATSSGQQGGACVGQADMRPGRRRQQQPRGPAALHLPQAGVPQVCEAVQLPAPGGPYGKPVHPLPGDEGHNEARAHCLPNLHQVSETKLPGVRVVVGRVGSVPHLAAQISSTTLGKTQVPGQHPERLTQGLERRTLVCWVDD